MFQHFAFGLCIESEIEFAELENKDFASADITITIGELPASLPGIPSIGPTWQALQKDLLIHLRGIASIRVQDGNSIVVAPGTDVPLDLVKLHLMGIAFAALLQQRRHVTMHASCVGGPQGAILFVGQAGAGKSTLAAKMVLRGYKLFSDDFTPLSLDPDGQVLATPTYPTCRLWNDMALEFGSQFTSKTPLACNSNKIAFLVDPFQETAAPVTNILALSTSPSGELVIAPMSDRVAFQHLRQCIYRRNFMEGMGQNEIQFAVLTHLVKLKRTSILQRPFFDTNMDRLADAVEQSMKGSRLET